MAGDNAWDQTVINPLERPLADDINQAQSQLYRTIRDLLQQQYLSGSHDGLGTPQLPLTLGLVGSAGRITWSAGMQLAMQGGAGFFYDPLSVPNPVSTAPAEVSDLSPYKPVSIVPTNPAFTAPAADPVNPRIDIIEVSYRRLVTNSSSRNVLNPLTGQFQASSVLKTLQWIIDSGGFGLNDTTKAINYKQGTPANPAVVPAVDAGYVKIAEILVPNAAVALTQENVRNLQALLLPHNLVRVSGVVQVAAGPVITLSNVVAPPGVMVVAAAPALTPNTVAGFTLYVIPNALPSAVEVTLSTRFDAGGKQMSVNLTNNYTVGNMAAGDVTNVEAAAASPRLTGTNQPARPGTGAASNFAGSPAIIVQPQLTTVPYASNPGGNDPFTLPVYCHFSIAYAY